MNIQEKIQVQGANAIIGVRLMSSDVMAGTAEMVAYGTAVVVQN